MTKNTTPLEQAEAEAFADYLRLKGFLFTHLSQEIGTSAKNWGLFMKQKRAGKTKGFPDYCICLKLTKKTTILVFFELKRAKKGLSKVSPEQKIWIDSLNNCNGVIAFISYGASDAIDRIEELIRIWPILKQIYYGIDRRCNDPNHTVYSYYGKRGIKNLFDGSVDFYLWAVRNGFKDGLTVERVDNDGNYEPFNLIWATRKEQANNRSSNRTISAFGKEMTLQQWADEKGISREVIATRLNRGWDAERALTIKPRLGRNQFKGADMAIKWVEEHLD